jgi:hypothetical protein
LVICATKQTLNSLKNKLIKDGKIEHGGTVDNKQILDIAVSNCFISVFLLSTSDC